MGNIFNSFSPVNPGYKNEKAEILAAYEEHYMKLLRNYKNEIHEIEDMMAVLRKEREEFYKITLPQIEHSIIEDKVISEEVKEKWVSELVSNVEKSFHISEDLISHYVTKNLEEFKHKLQSEINKE